MNIIDIFEEFGYESGGEDNYESDEVLCVLDMETIDVNIKYKSKCVLFNTDFKICVSHLMQSPHYQHHYIIYAEFYKKFIINRPLSIKQIL